MAWEMQFEDKTFKQRTLSRPGLLLITSSYMLLQNGHYVATKIKAAVFCMGEFGEMVQKLAKTVILWDQSTTFASYTFCFSLWHKRQHGIAVGYFLANKFCKNVQSQLISMKMSTSHTHNAETQKKQTHSHKDVGEDEENSAEASKAIHAGGGHCFY